MDHLSKEVARPRHGRKPCSTSGRRSGDRAGRRSLFLGWGALPPLGRILGARFAERAPVDLAPPGAHVALAHEIPRLSDKPSETARSLRGGHAKASHRADPGPAPHVLPAVNRSNALICITVESDAGRRSLACRTKLGTASAAMGGLMRYPCAQSQCRRLSRFQASGFSTPSATTLRPMPWASATVEATIA